MRLDYPISTRAYELAEQICKREVLTPALTPDLCEGFNPTEVRIVIREALRQRLTDIGSAPQRGERFGYARLQQLNDAEITRLQDMDITLCARYALLQEQVEVSEEAV